MECVFRNCYAVKSWLDLRDKNVAVVHCSDGKRRTGILIACYLKYIGAFEHASDAFDFFCASRNASRKVDSISLAPSYRILFENVDRAVDHGAFYTHKPLHLRCIALSGLPVDDIPCVEIWGMRGLIFCSHDGDAPKEGSTWSAEFGDGFFKVGTEVLGDFCIMVRFGGSGVATRDKTTLIFKYEPSSLLPPSGTCPPAHPHTLTPLHPNSLINTRYQNTTAFLGADVVELKTQNIDVSPRCVDALDAELFSLHLVRTLPPPSPSPPPPLSWTPLTPLTLPLIQITNRKQNETKQNENRCSRTPKHWQPRRWRRAARCGRCQRRL